MKLNYRQTILVGFAFLSICSFWQMYDNLVPLILKNNFGIGDTLSGFIMALDNILAVFLLPLFGALSDKVNTKLGRRTPFILVGTVLAVIFMLLIPYAANAQLLWLFFITLGMTLFSMGIYRSPAVALMPDVTPAALRSKGNAVINLMGALGGIYTLVVTKLLIQGSGVQDYTPVFFAVAVLMLLSVALLILTIRENKLRISDIKPELETKTETEPKEKKKAEKLPPEVMRSLIFILLSVFLWFMGYNAVTTAFTKYAEASWSMNVGAASTCLLVATGGAIISYIPVGFVSSKIGRKKVILAGVLVLALCFGSGFFFTEFSPALYLIFALIGIAWASINVNSYPMVVEMGNAEDMGKYTGYYYTFSMLAQIITPIVSGALLEFVGYWTLFPYAALMVAGAFVTMYMVKHGDNRPDLPSDKLELLGAED
ncbi:MAG: SLC45 family MFS transporter [Clostridiales bacterium]|nr:SLC45 family MFS transporter [Clostridiales bacterium]